MKMKGKTKYTVELTEEEANVFTALGIPVKVEETPAEESFGTWLNGRLGMDRKTAQDILIAVACCYTKGLTCFDCPLFDENGRCQEVTEEQAIKAVRVLSKGV